jgi:hypothetical protein
MMIPRNPAAAPGFGSAPQPRYSSTELDVTEHWVNPNRDSARVGTVRVRLRKFVHHDCSVTSTKFGFFVRLPSMPMVDRDGAVLKDEETAKWKYRPAVTAVDRSTGTTLSDAVLAMIKERFPEMLQNPTAKPRPKSMSQRRPAGPPHTRDSGPPLPEDQVDDLWRDTELVR